MSWVVALTMQQRVTTSNVHLARLRPCRKGPLGTDLPAHKGMVAAVSVDASNRVLVSAGLDATLRTWDFRKQKLTGGSKLLAQRLLGNGSFEPALADVVRGDDMQELVMWQERIRVYASHPVSCLQASWQWAVR